MELHEIEKHAKALMTAHGVGSLAFEFDRGKRRLGCTHFVTIGNTSLAKKITLSRHYAVLLPEDEIRDVILHEIAHALAGHKAGHGPVWKAAARKVGAKPKRCAAPSASPEASVTAECPECFRPLAAQHRLPQRIYVCRVHRNRALTWKRNGVRVPVEEMPQNYRSRYYAAMQKGILP